MEDIWQEKYLTGEITFTKEQVAQCKLSVFELFKIQLSRYTLEPGAGWYAMKEDDEFFRFKWSERKYRPSQKYLKALQDNGWSLAYKINIF